MDEGGLRKTNNPYSESCAPASRFFYQEKANAELQIGTAYKFLNLKTSAVPYEPNLCSIATAAPPLHQVTPLHRPEKYLQWQINPRPSSQNGAFPTCALLTTTLLNFYAKCHLFSGARRLFAEIPSKENAVMWNVLIYNYSQLGVTRHSHSSLQLFQQMLRHRSLPNSHTFAGVFSAASALENAAMAHQAHCLVVKLVESSDVFVYSSIVNAYCKLGFLVEARNMFDEMPVRNSITWSTMVSGYASRRLADEAFNIFLLYAYCKLGYLVEARNVFDEMRVRNSITWSTMVSGYASRRLADEAFNIFRLLLSEGEEETNEFVFTSILSAFASPEFVKEGKQVHCLAIKNGLSEIVSVRNAVVSMYSKCGSLNNAVQVFDLSTEKNSITWSAMITGHAHNGEGKKALVLFHDMHLHGMKPSEYTLVGVLNSCSDTEEINVGKQVHAYLVKVGFESQMYITTSLVDMYAKCGYIVEAQKGFDYLHEPDLVLWTSMIGGYVQNGDNESAFSLYCRMQTKAIAPNELTMASVLKACSSLSSLEQGKQVHAHVVKNGFNLKVPIGSALSTMYAEFGALEDGYSVFRRMPSVDVISWNAMISGLSQNGFGNEALDLFEEMQREKAKPDYFTFVNVLSACSHMGLVDRGRYYFELMSQKFGLVPRVEHYACMVDILGRARKLLKAREFIESANIDHDLCLWRILMSTSRNYRDFETGIYAGEKLVELGSRESSAYVLLSSIYSALRSRKVIIREGLVKNQGVVGLRSRIRCMCLLLGIYCILRLRIYVQSSGGLVEL